MKISMIMIKDKLIVETGHFIQIIGKNKLLPDTWVECKHKHLVPIIDDDIYLYSLCLDCEKLFNDSKQGLIYNFSILGIDSDHYTEYKRTHNINLRRTDLERKARGL